jgi:hypothetical protein
VGWEAATVSDAAEGVFVGGIKRLESALGVEVLVLE